MRTSARKSEALEENEKVKEPNNTLDANQETNLLNGEHEEHVAINFPAAKSNEIAEKTKVRISRTSVNEY